MKKKDLLLLAGLLLAAGLAALILMAGRRGEAGAVTVRVDGQVVGIWSLAEDREEDIDTEYGHNHLSIRQGAAYMTEADCPDGYCMQQKKITGIGETIVCLPHRLVVEGVNMITKHTKQNAQDPNGGILHKEGAIDASNVMLVVGGKTTRVGFEVRDGKKVRIAKVDGSVIG